MCATIQYEDMRTRRRSRGAAAVAFAAAAVATVLAAWAPSAAAQPQQEPARSITGERIPFVAGPSPEKVQQQGQVPPYTCYWWYEASWPAGNPVPVTYKTFIECGEWSPGLPSWYSNQAVLRQPELGPVSTTAKDEGYLEGQVSVDATSPPVTRPNTLYVQHLTAVIHTPDENGLADIWTELPAGCIGLGTPIASCDLRYPDFAFRGADHEQRAVRGRQPAAERSP